MRSPDVQQLGVVSPVSVRDRVPGDRPIRKLRVMIDCILGESVVRWLLVTPKSNG